MGLSCSRDSASPRDVERVGRRPRFQSFDSKVKHVWGEADTDKDGLMSFKEVKRMIHKLNALIPTRELKRKFEEFDKDNNGSLDFDEFKSLWETVQSLPPLEEQFRAAAGGKDYMLADELRRFLALSHIADKSEFECAKLILKYEGATLEEIEKCEADDDFSGFPYLYLNGFLRLISNGNENTIARDDIVGKVYQDMTHPLSHYFISSSHNTYLSGNQINSVSSPDAITAALRRGVRVIELDCWDGQNEPIVNHGHTLCTPTSFKACLEAVKESAFVKSNYPVIITIENHCSHYMQIRQAELLNSVLGDALYRWEGRAHMGGDIDYSLGPLSFLSPEELKGKVVVRDKPKRKHKKSNAPSKDAEGATLHEELGRAVQQEELDVEPANLATTGAGVVVEEEGQRDKESNSGQELDGHGQDDHNSQTSEETILSSTAAANAAADSSIDVAQAQPLNQPESAEDDEDGDCTTVLSGVPLELVKLIYIRNVKLQRRNDSVGFHDPPFASSSSINEIKMTKLTKPGEAANEMCKYSRSHIVRVYPAGKRIDSSNYDPVPAWNAGCQLVALNYQTFSDSVLINEAKFSNNGCSGYVLKPGFMQEADTSWNGTAPEGKQDNTHTLKINVISGHYLPKPHGASARSEVIDPYVSIMVTGVAPDQASQSTKVVQDNGFNPSWKEIFTFDISVPEMASIIFKVYDHDRLNADDFIGYFGLPVVGIAQGFRVVPLLDKFGAPLDGAYLFVHVTWSPSAPVI